LPYFLGNLIGLLQTADTLR